MKHLGAVLVVTMVALSASAGVVFEMENRDLTKPAGEAETTRMLLAGENVKLDLTGSTGEGEVIFLGAKKEMLVVNHEDRSFFVVDEEQLRGIADQVNQAMASMEQALANLPPAQREQMKQMMAGRMPDLGEKREPSELKKTGDRETVNGYPCERYDVWRAGVKERELWITPWSRLEGGDEVREVFVSLAEFSRTLLDSVPMAGDQAMTDPSLEHLDELDGFPVRTVEFATDGTALTEALFKGAETANPSASEFMPPKGYKRRDLRALTGR